MQFPASDGEERAQKLNILVDAVIRVDQTFDRTHRMHHCRVVPATEPAADFRVGQRGQRLCQIPVSYTHLTLPTSDLV